ncbi:hypothetical protein D3C84_752110 [compost metagenome]
MYGGFGYGIRKRGAETVLAGDAADINDRSAAVLANIRRDSPRTVEHAFHVHAEQIVPYVIGDRIEIFERDMLRNAGVVNQHMNRTEMPYGGFGHCTYFLILRYVSSQSDGSAAFALDYLDGFFRIGLRPRIVDDDIRSPLGEEQ